jgi:tetratricopeptide (TPR) repeat protein/Flp pilus assembly protein TadD
MWFHDTPVRRRLLLGGSLTLLTLVAISARADLARWVQDVEGAGRLEAIFFRAVSLPGGPALVRRPPDETRAALSQLISAAPSDAELLSLRALEDEQQLDFAAAEADWKQYAQSVKDPAAGQLALADFYHRRLRPQDEVAALAAAAQAPSPDSERLVAPAEQRSWLAFERIFVLIGNQALPADLAADSYRKWMARYPQESSVAKRFFRFLLEQKRFADAEQHIAAYQKSFPSDEVFPVSAHASLAQAKGSTAEALALYDRSFQPLWPPELVNDYFSLLGQTHNLRAFLDRARAAVAANPEDLNSATRLFYYYQQQGNLEAARRVLVEFRLRKESRNSAWKADELLTLARLYEGVQDSNEAIRHYYALYSLPGADPASTEKALAGIIDILFTAPEQPLRFGSGDLSLYRDIATLDPYPGFLNSILSLLLNSASPHQAFAQEENNSIAYFHRLRAAELLALFDSRYPNSPQRPALHARLLEAYALYGDFDGVIRGGREFLAAFPSAPQRTRVAFLMADAFARKNQVEEEFVLYDSLLKELAERAQGIPLGRSTTATQPASSQEHGEATEGEEGERQPAPAANGPRSPEYARVLDRYISRLVSRKEIPKALALYRQEIDRNPNDPALYERLANFLEQNDLRADVEQIYRRAMLQFPERSWHHRLARWYLRRKQTAAFEQLTREVVQAFAGSELEDYFRDVVGGSGPQMYLSLNLYAHQRFPHNLTFVRNLLSAYTNKATYNRPAWLALLRGYWFYDADLRNQFFAELSRTGQLQTELQALRPANPPSGSDPWSGMAKINPAAAQFVGEAEAWQSRFEEAAAPLRALTAQYPAEVELGRRVASLHRSLAAFDPSNTEAAVQIEEKLAAYQPRDRETLTRIGETWADREMLDRSRPYWNRIAEIEPGRADGYLEAATVFWDYYLFDDALRLIHEGRSKLNQPALYAYEAGAVHENKREYARALEEYVQGALVSEENSPARSRLLELARRPAHRAAADEATARLVTANDASPAALSLRIALLETQNRRDELGALLAAKVESASSLELLERIDGIADRDGFPAVRVRAFERRITLLSDPVERIRLWLALMRFHEGKGDLVSARKVMESLYAENPTVLGVVRAAADFYWRNKMQPRAIEVLRRAAAASNPGLKKQFTFEAARKSTESGDVVAARQLLQPLLKDDPFNAEYLAAMADTYARASDDAGLRDFYLAAIQSLRDAPLAAEERYARVAALRRGLIPALTRLKDPAGAVDQYIEILKRYPEDASVAEEAARYAERQGRKEQLLAYFTKAVADSPKDFRWPMVLARLQTSFEDFPAAIDAYSKATQIRPDRLDLHTARATLEERLMRFDQALVSYGKIYELAYHDPQWMEKIAELHARRGETEAAVGALRKAMIEGRPERPRNFFAVARRLESWNLLPQAKQFAEKGMDLAGNDLFAEPEYSSGAQIYARVMARLREHEAAYARLHSAWQAAAAKGGDAEEGEESEGSQASQRVLSGFRSALEELGSTAGRYFTPEERASFAAFLEKQRATATVDELSQALLPLVQHAGLADLEARWRLEVLLARPNHPSNWSHLGRLVELQKRRLKFNELGAQLQQYAAVVPHEQMAGILLQAAQNYRTAGNTTAELAILTRLGGFGDMPRYLELLLARNPQRLVQMAALPLPNATADAATNFAVSSGNFPLALQAIQAHGRTLPPVWTRGYTALTGLYYANPAPLVNTAFLEALGNATIGERVGKPVDRTQQLAGDVWFYYGSRYGEYLGATHQGTPEDYLPAALEGAPARASAYTDLGDYYRDARDPAHALEEYEHALELAPDRGDLHDRVALLLWDQGNHEAAAERWKSALETFIRAQNAGRIQQSFWADASQTLNHIGRRKLLAQMRDSADRLLRDYIKRNGSYRVTPMLRATLSASGDPVAGVAWIIDLANAAQSPEGFLGEMVNAKWLPDAQRDLVFRRILELSEKRVAAAHGAEVANQRSILRNWQIQYLSYLVKTRQTERAQTVLAAIPPEPPGGASSDSDSEERSTPQAPDLAVLEIRLAAQQNKLAELMDRYTRQPEKMAPVESLRAAALALRVDGDAASARRVLEFLYTYELDQRNFDAGNFLGLAELRLEAGDVPGALALLRRMNLVAGQPFENLEAAAALLEKTGHPAEAVEFRSARVQAVPWDLAARRALAETQLSSQQDHGTGVQALAAVARSRDAAYDVRAAAALALGRAKAAIADLGSADLGFLSAGGTVAAIERPFFHYSRVEAAKTAKDPAVRVRLLSAAIAIQPDSDSARLALFRAAADSRRWPLAVAALTPLVESSNAYRGEESEAEQGEGEDESAAEPPTPAGFLARITLEPAERALLARTLADALQKLDRFPEAQTYFQTALALEPDAAARTQIRQRLAALKAEMVRHARDEQRRPRVSPNLEQQNLVRPRLLARSTPAPAPPVPAKGGTPR